MQLFGAFGITGGAHRLWAHKAYKAKVPLRIFLMILQTLAFQNCIYEWVRDHRVHHKYTDTNADPHNSKRGFFFSHMGWLLCKKHNDVKIKGATIDMSDLEMDPVVMFQKKHYLKLMPLISIVIPFLIPYIFYGETVSNSWYCGAIFRYISSLHGTWLVNSYAHFFGMKPYEKNISPTNSLFVGILAVGEGWHNYHHVFPWDYKAAELGQYSVNFTTAFIDFFAMIGMDLTNNQIRNCLSNIIFLYYIGWAYDLKTVSEEMVRKRILRTGDGSHKFSLTENIKTQLPDHSVDENLVWGWDDKDMTDVDKKDAQILNKID